MKVAAWCFASATAAVLAVKAWDRFIGPKLWERALRRSCAGGEEPCILDVSESNVASFRRGGVALIKKDLLNSQVPQHLIHFFECLLVLIPMASRLLCQSSHLAPTTPCRPPPPKLV
mmetsp:Transcript_38633/g.60267  ORF Transcript_38633/g.60267 Transcript_38633/m.60267 type:complete len:117 (+) Transcript_38633:184-534(+)